MKNGKNRWGEGGGGGISHFRVSRPHRELKYRSRDWVRTRMTVVMGYSGARRLVGSLLANRRSPAAASFNVVQEKKPTPTGGRGGEQLSRGHTSFFVSECISPSLFGCFNCKFLSAASPILFCKLFNGASSEHYPLRVHDQRREFQPRGVTRFLSVKERRTPVFPKLRNLVLLPSDRKCEERGRVGRIDCWRIAGILERDVIELRL